MSVKVTFPQHNTPSSNAPVSVKVTFPQHNTPSSNAPVSVKVTFPQHNISNAKYKEILIIIYCYKYTFSLAVVGG